MHIKILLCKVGDHPTRARVTVVPTPKDSQKEVASILREYDMAQVIAYHTEGDGHYAMLRRILPNGKQEEYKLSIHPTLERLKNFGGGIDVSF